MDDAVITVQGAFSQGDLRVIGGGCRNLTRCVNGPPEPAAGSAWCALRSEEVLFFDIIPIEVMVFLRLVTAVSSGHFVLELV